MKTEEVGLSAPSVKCISLAIFIYIIIASNELNISIFLQRAGGEGHLKAPASPSVRLRLAHFDDLNLRHSAAEHRE